MNAVTWAKGLLASVIGSVATTVLASGISSGTGVPLNWAQIGSIAASAALVGACLYLKQSPIPDADTTTVTSTTTVTTPHAGDTTTPVVVIPPAPKS